MSLLPPQGFDLGMAANGLKTTMNWTVFGLSFWNDPDHNYSGKCGLSVSGECVNVLIIK